MSTSDASLRSGFRFAHQVEPWRHNAARYEVIKGLMSMTYGRVEPVYPGLRRTLFTTLILPY